MLTMRLYGRFLKRGGKSASRHSVGLGPRPKDCAEFIAPLRWIEMQPVNTHVAYADCRGFGLAFPAIGAFIHYRLLLPAQAESEVSI
jgi:hypothetical protein